MNGVTINGKHSLDDFGVYLQPKSIPVPAAKTVTVSVKGADGEIDLSTALTDGNIRYENRIIELSFAVIDTEEKTLDVAIEEFVTAIHGKTLNLVFDDDPEHYFVGRCEVTQRDYQHGYAIITCKFNAEPFRYDVEVTTVTKDVSGTANVILLNSRQWVVPTITSSAAMQVIYQGVIYTVMQGMHVNDNIVLREGENVLGFIGNGTVTIEYRQGVL